LAFAVGVVKHFVGVFVAVKIYLEGRDHTLAGRVQLELLYVEIDYRMQFDVVVMIMIGVASV